MSKPSSSSNQNQEMEEKEFIVDLELLNSMQERTKNIPKLLNTSASRASCSIFRVPQNIMNLHPGSFKPEIVSIGPYYHGQPHLQMIEEHKWRILGNSLDRLKGYNIFLEDFFKEISIKEEEIRDCYSENIDKFNTGELIQMMILDGCFIIELLCVIEKIINPIQNDPIFNIPWILVSLTRDLLRLENQIPFFVLQCLYKLSISDVMDVRVPPLQELILELCKYSGARSTDGDELRQKYSDAEGEHILDFYRSTFIPLSEKEVNKSPGDDSSKSLLKEEAPDPAHPEAAAKRRDPFKFIQPVEKLREHILHFYRSTFIPLSEKDNTKPPGDDSSKTLLKEEAPDPAHPEAAAKRRDPFKLIQPVEKLREAGIKFEERKGSESFLDIKFRENGVLEIPRLITDDMMSSFILNCIAFEQSYKHSTKHFTSYVIFMGCLINTVVDSGHLRDEKIIENFFGTDKEVVKFFNEVGRDVTFNIEETYLGEVFKDVDTYYRNVWHVRWAGFKYNYFGSPWIFLSALVALILLLLTILQSFFAVYSYFNPPS